MTGRNASIKRHSNYLELEFKTGLLPYASGSTGKEGCYVLARVIDLDYQGEIGLLLCNGGKEEYVWNTGDPLGILSVAGPCDNGQWKTTDILVQTELLMAHTLPSQRKVWVTQQVKNQDQQRCLLKAKVIENGFLEENSGKYQPRLCDELQK